jgi:hypothetical protein
MQQTIFQKPEKAAVEEMQKAKIVNDGEAVLILVNSGLVWKHNEYKQFSADGTCLIIGEKQNEIGT